MNKPLQELDSIGLKIDGEVCMRAKVDIGTRCNLACNFCYYKDYLNIPEKSLSTILQQIDYLMDRGFKDLELSGGEPLFHRELFAIIDYIKLKGGKFSVVTNAFFAPDLLKRLIDKGLQDILISMHHVVEFRHNNIVRLNNNAVSPFKQIMKTIKLCKEYAFPFRINMVLNDSNLDIFDYNLADIINDLAPTQINFLPVNSFHNKELADKELICEKLKLVIPLINQTIDINVRYVPFCYMAGFERYVKNIFQHITDLTDWNFAAYDQDKPVDAFTPDNIEQTMLSQLKQMRLYQYKKDKRCLHCQYFTLCDGYQKG